MSLHSAACCSVPPVVSKDYSQKGKYITVDGLKTYATGPPDAKKAILIIYDIFGYFPQTIQGADILAYGDKENQYQVFMPDFFEGSPADISWYPPDNGAFALFPPTQFLFWQSRETLITRHEQRRRARS